MQAGSVALTGLADQLSGPISGLAANQSHQVESLSTGV
jgi:hypothetical protein